MPERACCCVPSLLDKRVVKVNFCLFCAKNVLGLGVEFFALFQDGLLVVVVVDGIGPKLCFQAKTATLGVDCLAQVSAQKVSAVKLHARHIVCGDDHRFGYMGACGIRELEKLCAAKGIGLTVVPPVTLDDGTRISSTAIRKALQTRDLALVEKMLGRSVDFSLPTTGA